jgi:hypothetical protein
MLDVAAKREIRAARATSALSTFAGPLKLTAVAKATRLRRELMVRSGSGTGS